MPTTFSPGTVAFMVVWLLMLGFWASWLLLNKMRKKKSRVPFSVSNEEIKKNRGFSTGETTLMGRSSGVVAGAGDETIVGILKNNCQQHPEQILLRWVNSKCQVDDSLTYESLWRQSGAIASLLVRKGLTKGDRVIIAYPPGLPFLSAFVACLRTGIIACSVYPPDPTSKARAKFSFEQFNDQVIDSGAKFALTTKLFKRMMQIAPMTVGQTTKVEWIATDTIKSKKEKGGVEDDQIVAVAKTDIAFIQYSSGSTGVPKGVMISHGAMLHNLSCFHAVSFETEFAAVGVSWLPQYHDYGLFTSFLWPMYAPNLQLVSFSPVDFIRNPLLWADVMEKFGATHTAGPNFAYGLLAKRMKAANRVLQQSKTKLCGASIAAETIMPETFEAMVEIGIPSGAINASYGMSECCVYLTSIWEHEEGKTLDGVVSVGLMARAATHNNQVVIADSKTRAPLEDGSVGEIHISSPSLSSGYWRKPDLNRAAFNIDLQGGSFFATGDLGKIVDGRLYVLGRSKELIIVNGKNIYPTDLGQTIEKAYPTLVRPGSTVAYQYSPTEAGIVLEVRTPDFSEDELSADAIRKLISNAHGLETGRVDILKKGAVPKTTSGKLRRKESMRISLNDEWPLRDVAASWQSGSMHMEVQASSQKASQDNAPAYTNLDKLLFDFLGGDFDPEQEWDSLGLSSISSVELRNVIATNFLIALAPDCFDRHRTPAAPKRTS